MVIILYVKHPFFSNVPNRFLYQQLTLLIYVVFIYLCIICLYAIKTSKSLKLKTLL